LKQLVALLRIVEAVFLVGLLEAPRLLHTAKNLYCHIVIIS
jgi:hypothetical protein